MRQVSDAPRGDALNEKRLAIRPSPHAVAAPSGSNRPELTRNASVNRSEWPLVIVVPTALAFLIIS